MKSLIDNFKKSPIYLIYGIGLCIVSYLLVIALNLICGLVFNNGSAMHFIMSLTLSLVIGVPIIVTYLEYSYTKIRKYINE